MLHSPFASVATCLFRLYAHSFSFHLFHSLLAPLYLFAKFTYHWEYSILRCRMHVQWRDSALCVRVRAGYSNAIVDMFFAKKLFTCWTNLSYSYFTYEIVLISEKVVVKMAFELIFRKERYLHMAKCHLDHYFNYQPNISFLNWTQEQWSIKFI